MYKLYHGDCVLMLHAAAGFPESYVADIVVLAMLLSSLLLLLLLMMMTIIIMIIIRESYSVVDIVCRLQAGGSNTGFKSR